MTASQQPTYTQSVVSLPDADPNYSPWLPPTEAEYAQATAEVDRRKHRTRAERVRPAPLGGAR